MYVDSLEFYDTLNRDFRILKAYINKDTHFFKKLDQEIKDDQQVADFTNPWDSCVHKTKLSDLKVGGAFRFRRWEAFCPFGLTITITMKDDKINLHYIEHSNGDGHALKIIKPGSDTIVVNPYCTIIKEFEKSLSLKDWTDLTEKIFDAGYWQMKERAGGGLDGSIWQIDAYSEETYPGSVIRNSHSVWRHSLFSKGFREIADFMILLSGEKTMCNEF